MAKNNGILLGLKDICNYTGYTILSVKNAIENEGFPAVKRARQWESNTTLIDEWQIRVLRRKIKI